MIKVKKVIIIIIFTRDSTFIQATNITIITITTTPSPHPHNTTTTISRDTKAAQNLE